tara:strand:- start:689 stop:853 length:165 start_codon:yes stop_codon:yes gene_type:complete
MKENTERFDIFQADGINIVKISANSFNRSARHFGGFFLMVYTLFKEIIVREKVI